jgi:hypothetical protein
MFHTSLLGLYVHKHFYNVGLLFFLDDYSVCGGGWLAVTAAAATEGGALLGRILGRACPGSPGRGARRNPRSCVLRTASETCKTNNTTEDSMSVQVFGQNTR